MPRMVVELKDWLERTLVRKQSCPYTDAIYSEFRMACLRTIMDSQVMGACCCWVFWCILIIHSELFCCGISIHAYNLLLIPSL
jgi:hypothetical protein